MPETKVVKVVGGDFEENSRNSILNIFQLRCLLCMDPIKTSSNTWICDSGLKSLEC